MRRFLIALFGVLMVIGGVFCMFRPITTFMQTGYVIGVIILCDAVSNIITWVEAKKHVEVSGWYLAKAILSAIFGIMIICSLGMQLATDIVITYMIAIWTIIAGIIRVLIAIRMKGLQEKLPEVFKNNKWMVIWVLGMLIIIFIIKPAVLMSVLGAMIAWAMIFIGANIITISTYVF